MKKAFFFFVAFLLSMHSINAQKTFFSSLYYSNDCEREMLMKSPIDTANKLLYFLNLRGNCDSRYWADVKFWFSETVEALKAKKVDKKSPKKKIAISEHSCFY